MANANGKIYIDTSTTPNKGVEIADLQQVLRRGTGDLGQLCSDQEAYDTGAVDERGNPIYALRPLNPPRINKWAKYKPVSVNTPAIITEQQRIDTNQGFTGSKMHASAESTAYKLASDNNYDWEYLHNSLPYYRILDFIPPSLSGYGYDHGAEKPFVLGGAGRESSPDTHSWFGVSFSYNTAQIRLSDLAIYNDTDSGSQYQETWIYGMLYKYNSESYTSARFCPLYSQVGSSGYSNIIIPDNATAQQNITGYFFVDRPASAKSLTAALCVAKIRNTTGQSVTLRDFMFLPVQDVCDIYLSNQLANTFACWFFPPANDVPLRAIQVHYFNQQTPIGERQKVTAIDFLFNITVEDFSRLVYAIYTFQLNRGSVASSVSINSNDFTINPLLDTGRYNLLITDTFSAADPVYTDNMRDLQYSFMLSSGGGNIWYELDGAGCSAQQPRLPRQTVTETSTLEDIVTAIGQDNVRFILDS